jgi:predicted dehydrogenase
MGTPLGIGVIGLGPVWERTLPVLNKLRHQLEVHAVYDQSAQVVEETAHRIGCSPSAGTVELLEREEVKAVLLLDPQWFGLWPLRQASRLGKPVFVAPSLLHETDVDSLGPVVQQSRLPVMVGSKLLQSPALVRLRHLLAQHLGGLRSLRVDRRLRHLPASVRKQDNRHLLGCQSMLGMLNICAAVFASAPVSIWAMEAEHSPLATVLLEFGPDRVAQLNLWIDRFRPPGWRIDAVADQGHAEARLPRLLTYFDKTGSHRQHWRRQPIRRVLLQRFAQAVQSGQGLQPGFDNAYQSLLWWRAARRSQQQGGRVFLTPEGSLLG